MEKKSLRNLGIQMVIRFYQQLIRGEKSGEILALKLTVIM